MEHYSQKTNYADYLNLPSLLNSQQPLSEHPDELHFIIVHQVHELWFKLALHHLERARTAIQDDLLIEATRLVNQVVAIFVIARQTAEHLHTLPPMAFHRFRELLAPGSGMQSFQFREIEFLVGLRDEQHVNWTKRQLAKADHWEQVLARLSEPSFTDIFQELLKTREIPDVASIYEFPEKYPDVYLLAEALSELDHRVMAWRHSHIQLVERTIGSGVKGTGGTTHDYLLATLKKPFFPDLWEARNVLTRRSGLGE